MTKFTGRVKGTKGRPAAPGKADVPGDRPRSETVRARMPADLKRDAEAILGRIGTTGSEAIRMFYAQVVLRGGLPFDVAIPNEATLRAVEELQQGKATRVESMDDLVQQVSETEPRVRRARVVAEDDLPFVEEAAAPLSDRDRDRFLDLLANPPAPTPALKAADARQN